MQQTMGLVLASAMTFPRGLIHIYVTPVFLSGLGMHKSISMGRLRHALCKFSSSEHTFLGGGGGGGGEDMLDVYEIWYNILAKKIFLTFCWPHRVVSGRKYSILTWIHSTSKFYTNDPPPPPTTVDEALKHAQALVSRSVCILHVCQVVLGTQFHLSFHSVPE